MNKNSMQSLGGKARAAALSEEQRKAIAAKGGKARWGDRPMKATHKGNFKKEFGIDVDCYVLDDLQKTAVISQSGMGRALGLSSGGSKFPRFLATDAISARVGPELAQKLAQPVKFQWGTGGPEQPPTTIHGFDVTLLVDVCRIIIVAEAEGKLGNRYERVSAQARIILAASAKWGIKSLVYALAGYSPTTEEVIAAFKIYVQEEARKYAWEFPNELYEQWYKLYQIPPLTRGKPWEFKYLTIRHVYFPLAQSHGLVLKLMRALKAADGDRQKKLFQFLSELGARTLRMQLGRVLEMAESSKDRQEYERKIVERFGGQQELDLVFPPTQ